MSIINIANSSFVENRKATINPTTTDDINSGYSIGSTWYNITSLTQFICTNNTANGAVWQSISSSDGQVSTTPTLSGDSTVVENTSYTLTITNYNASNVYGVFVSGGTWSRTGSVITWYVPTVTQDETGTISVISIEPGLETSKSANKFVTITNIPYVNDSILLYENSTINEFTELENINISNNKLVANANTRKLDVNSNIVSSAGSLDIGDIISLDGVQYSISTTTESLDSTYSTNFFNDKTELAVMPLDSDVNNLYGSGTTLASGNITYISGKFGNCAHIPDDASYLKISGLSTVKSYSLWFNGDIGSQTNRYLLDTRVNDGDGALSVDTVFSILNCSIKVDGVSVSNGGAAPTYGEWHHLYIELTGTATGGIFGNYSGAPGASYALSGGIDQIRVFNRALTDAEIAELILENKKTKINTTTPTIPSLITSAELITKTAKSNIVAQDISDTDFIGLNNITVKQEFENIASDESVVNTLESDSEILSGDKLVISDGTNTGVITVNTVNASSTTPGNISGITDSGSDYSIAQSGQIHSFTFDDTGTYFYASPNAAVVYPYTLSTPWDISTAVYNGASFATSITAYGIVIKPDGKELYVCNGSVIANYSLSVPNDITTASLTATSNTLNFTSALSFNFSADGSKLFTQCNSGILYSYSLSTPWDISSTSLTYDGISKDLSALSTNVYGSSFNNNGTRYYIGGYTQNSVIEYSLATPYDIANMVATGNSVSVSGVMDVSISHNGDKLFSYIYGSVVKEFNTNSIINVFKSYSIDTSSVTIGNIPTLAYKQNSNFQIEYEIDAGFNDLAGRSDLITSQITPTVANPILVTSTYSDQLDITGGRNLTTKVKLNTVGDKVSKITGTIQKIA